MLDTAEYRHKDSLSACSRTYIIISISYNIHGLAGNIPFIKSLIEKRCRSLHHIHGSLLFLTPHETLHQIHGQYSL